MSTWNRAIVFARAGGQVAAMLVALALALSLASIVMHGCSSWHTTYAAQTAAAAANRLEPCLVGIEQAQEDALIAKGKPTMDVERTWVSFWLAWNTWRVAHARWVIAIEADADDVRQREKAATTAWCAALALVPSSVPAEMLASDRSSCAKDGIK